MIFALNFFLRRIAQGIIVVVSVAFIVFALLRVVPGDPIRIILGPMTPPSVMEETARELGLHDPIPIQFVRYLGQIIEGELGHSFIRGKQGGSTGGSRGATTHASENRATVSGLIATALPYSLLLAAMGILFTVVISFPVGIAAGLRVGGWQDKLSLYLSSLFVSLPNIWIGVVFIYLFSAKTGWLPAIGFKGFAYVILPALVLTVELSPIMIRAITVSVAKNMQENYVDVGRVRGLPRRIVVVKHVFRNASVPLLNLFGVQLIGMLLGGLFVVEYIFTFPGLGLLTINAIFQRDFPIVQAISILAGSVLVVVNMLVDFVSTTIDRRLQL